ncbi:MAG TPA: DUF2948 family protein [Methylocystis sp.]|nr:DUF2948 family protein [Methylocystis sp.]
MASEQTRPKAPPLRLHALDEEDLHLLSACLQDALLRVGDMAFLPHKRRFALVADRFDWAADACDGVRERARAGLHFEAVRHVRYKGVARDYPNMVLELLTISFAAGPEPEGRIQLNFAGGAAISLDVDCIEAQLGDLGPRWRVASRPAHELDEGAAARS